MREARGVVIEAPGAPARIEPIVVDPPDAGEVLVRIVANGVCHSDLWAIEHGNWGSPFPMLLGHEAAGIVEETGDRRRSRRARRPRPAGLGGSLRRLHRVPAGPPASMRSRVGAAPAPAHDGRRPLVGTLSIGGLATHTVVQAPQVIPRARGTRSGGRVPARVRRLHRDRRGRSTPARSGPATPSP